MAVLTLIIRRRPVVISSALAAGVLLAAPASVSAATAGRQMTLPELAKASDDIVIGKVSTVKSRWVGNHIETDAEIAVTDSLKKSSKISSEKFVLTVQGGSTQHPPISQYATLTPAFHEGEEVALFLKQPEPDSKRRSVIKAVAPDSHLADTPRIVGGYQGKFSIIKDARDGKRKVVRLQLDLFDAIPTPKGLQNALQLVANHSIAVTSAPVVALKPDEASLNLVPKTPSGVSLGALKKSNPIPVMELDSFVAEVTTNSR